MDSPTAPRPLPLESGFSTDRVYEVFGIHTPSETAEAWLILKNDRDEMWFISNRHCRFAKPEAVVRSSNGKVGHLHLM